MSVITALLDYRVLLFIECRYSSHLQSYKNNTSASLFVRLSPKVGGQHEKRTDSSNTYFAS